MPSHRYGNSAKALQHPPYVLAVVLSLQSRMQPRTQVHPEAVLMTAKVPSVDSNDQKGLGVVPEAEAEAEGATLKDVNPQGTAFPLFVEWFEDWKRSCPQKLIPDTLVIS
jgi:hypothetical protein